MKIILLLILSSSIFAFDNQISNCGEYDLEGKLVQKKAQYKLILNQGSESEVKIALGRSIPKESMKFLNKRVRTRVNIFKECRYHCIGKLVEVLHVIPYSRQMQTFSPWRDLIEKKECKKIKIK